MTSTRSKSRGNAAAGGTATLHMQALQPSGIDALGVFPLDGDVVGAVGSTTPLYRRSMPSSVPDRGGGVGGGASCPYLNNYNTRRAASASAGASVPSRGLGGGFCRGSVGGTTHSNPGSWGAAGAGPSGGSDMLGGYPSPAGSLYGRRGMPPSNVGGASERGGASSSAASSPIDRYLYATSPSPYGTDTTQFSNVWPSTGVSTTETGSSSGTVDTGGNGDGEGNSHNFENSLGLNLEQRATGTTMASSTSPPRRASDGPDSGAGDSMNESSIFARWFRSGSSASGPPRGPPQVEEPSAVSNSNVNEPGSPPVPPPIPVQGEFSPAAASSSEPLAAAVFAPPPRENITPAASASSAAPPPPQSPPLTRRRKRRMEQPPAEENRDSNVDEAKPRVRRSRRAAAQVKAEIAVVDVDKDDDDDDPSAPASDGGGSGSGVACCICLEVTTKVEQAKVNGCEHGFCFACIERWAERENTCPLCKVRFTKIDRVNKPPSRKRKKGDAPSPRAKNTKRVKNRDQRADFTGSNALQGLLANMESGSLPHSIAQFIFSNVTGGLMTLNGGTSGGGGPQGSNRISNGGISGRVVASAFPLQMGSNSNGPFSTRSSSRGMPPRAFHFELNPATSDRGGGAADDPFDPIVVRPASATTFPSGTSPTSSTLRRSLQRSMPPQQDTSWEQHLAASVGSSSDLDFDDEDDDEADGLGSGGDNYGSFIQRVRDLSNHRNSVLHRYQVGIGGGGGGGNGVDGPPRSYAVNSQDLTAGESAENALEIEDSDDDDDLDVVEVVDVGAN